MKTEEKINLELIRYYTMNSWNRSKAPAFNLKVYKVIPRDLQDKVFEQMEAEDFYAEINLLISEFKEKHNFAWQAGFNGRSGGYLVLYKGEQDESGRIGVYPGKNIEVSEVPDDILESFRQLAVDIVKNTIYRAKNCHIKEEKYTVSKTRKVICDN